MRKLKHLISSFGMTQQERQHQWDSKRSMALTLWILLPLEGCELSHHQKISVISNENIMIQFNSRKPILLAEQQLLCLLVIVLSLISCGDKKMDELSKDKKLESPKALTGASSFSIGENELVSLKEAANNGDANAAFRLYQYFTFLASNEQEATVWLTVAAKLGHSVAQNNLAHMLFWKNNDLEKAEYWAKEAIKNGNQSAAELLKDIVEAKAKHKK
jgi:hypothetical protein